jgi:hypothetical protein
VSVSGWPRVTVTCDADGGCCSTFRSREALMPNDPSAVRQRALKVGWTFCTGSGGRRDLCPKHKPPAIKKPSASPQSDPKGVE